MGCEMPEKNKGKKEREVKENETWSSKIVSDNGAR